MTEKDEVVFKEYLTNTNDNHNKFYEVEVIKNGHFYKTYVRHGKIGCKGRRLFKWDSILKKREIDKAKLIIESKLDKGYKKSKSKKSGKKEEIKIENKELQRFTNLEW